LIVTEPKVTKGVYKNAQGKRIPRVTTITGCWSPSKEGLLRWAWQCGIDGKDYRDERDTAAGIGTICHSMVEDSIKGLTPDAVRSKWSMAAPDHFLKADVSFGAYLKWAEQHRFKPLETEVSLISQEFQYGGTMDCVPELDGEVYVMDWKTGSIYPPAVMQLASYRQLWNENRETKIKEGHLIRFDKETGSFTTHFFPEAVLDFGWECFVALRRTYELDKILSKAIG
jgi:hypothetical protein